MPIKPEDWQLFDIATLKSITLNFLKELEDASAGKKTSLPFIRNTIPSSPLVGENEAFQVMVIGGSVYKQAMAVRKEGRFVFFEKKKENLSPFKTKDSFISFVEKHLDPKVRFVAINFAQPLEPVFDHGRLDGRLFTVTKEHGLLGLVRERVGRALEEHFRKKHKREITFTVANDTVCLLLSGMEQVSPDRLGGGIVGTGFNFAFFESPTRLVNLESGNFDKFPISSEAREKDLRSAQSGSALFEKEISGAYLYQHFNSIIKKRNINHSPTSSTEELNKMAMTEKGRASIIARSLIEKSAGLVACQIAGITLFKGHDMTFVMEGSLFWKADRYKEMVEGYVKQLAPEFKVSFVSVEDGHFLGAAKLVC